MEASPTPAEAGSTALPGGVVALSILCSGGFLLALMLDGPSQAGLVERWGLVPREVLRVFGEGVKRALGPRRFVLLFLGSALVGGWVQVAASPASFEPALGASGADAALLRGASAPQDAPAG